MAAGYTLKMPREEKRIKSKSEFLAEIAVSLGGYAAEKIKFGEITTGAANDLQKATLLAKKLVKEFGMSTLGPLSFSEDQELWGQLPEQKPYSEQTALRIDREVEKFVNQAEKMAFKILRQKRKLLEKIGRVLIEKETIEKEEFASLIGSKKAEKPQPLPKKQELVKVKVRRV